MENNPDVNKSTSTENPSLPEFDQLKQNLLVVTLVLTGVIFISVWIFYSLNIALNYLLGAIAGVVYLRMLAKDVERIGAGNQRFSPNRLALVAGLIIVGLKWEQLEFLPIFLGFLTYKITIIIYTLKTTLIAENKSVN